MKISSRGQVTIPKALRDKAGLVPLTEVEIVLEDDGVRIIRARNQGLPGRGEMVLERLRRNASHVAMTTDELMALTRGE